MSYDIVVMGAGHNGLTAAAYMAKAGKKVLVLESKPHFGGGVSTRELITPGYWHDEHSNVHIMIQGNPMLREDELGLLSRFGLEYIYPDLVHVSIWDDGTVNRDRAGRAAAGGAGQARPQGRSLRAPLGAQRRAAETLCGGNLGAERGDCADRA